MILVALNLLQLAVIVFLMLPESGGSARLAVEDALLEIGVKEKAELPKNATATQRFEWHKSQAERGIAESQYKLARAFWYGSGVHEDRGEARRWFLKAAEQGHDGAQEFLGEVYDYVLHDDNESTKWYRRAAEQGNARAQQELGDAYRVGRGVPRDYVKAYMWWSICVAGGREDAASWLTMLEERMTPAQVAEGKRLAREWQEKHQLMPDTKPKSTGITLDGDVDIVSGTKGAADSVLDPPKNILEDGWTEVPNAGALPVAVLRTILATTPNLKKLSLSESKIKDADLEVLSLVSGLTGLDLSFTEITDAGLVHIKGLTKLVFLDLSKTKVTDEGVASLKQALPNCEIKR